jgi:hypothetical protein
MMNSLVRIFTLGAAFAGFMLTQVDLQASPIMYTLSGTFVEATSGSDPFQLQGQSFTVTTTLDTTAVPVSTTATSDTFVSAAQFNSTFPLVGNISLTDPNAQITLDTAGTISVALAISALGQNIPVIANINIALSSPLPTPLVTSSVTGSATYGSGELATTLSLTGTLSTNPAGTPGGGGEVPEPATVVLAGGGLLALALARKSR